jgi:hypothetical protein
MGLMPKVPNAGDPRFTNGSVGDFGSAQTIKQEDGPAFLGFEVARNQNDGDKEQQNYAVTDANFTRFLGVIPNPDTGEAMSYAQTIQAYNAAGAIEALYPDVWAQLVANQDAGRGTVLGGVLAMFGATQSDGSGGASLQGIDDATIAQIRGAQLPGIGSLRDYAFNTRDQKGQDWARAHHPGSHWSALVGLVEQGMTFEEAAVFTGDSMTSWAGRVLGTNNQDGNEDGFANDEQAGLKYLVLMEQATGQNLLEKVIMSHAMTHIPESELTNPKINGLIGMPENFRPQSQADIQEMATRLRQYAANSNYQIDQGEFQEFVNAGANTAMGQQLAASGLLNTVQFKQNNNNGNENAGNENAGNEAAEEAITPTGAGTGEITRQLTPIGSGETITPDVPGSPTIDTRPRLENLGEGGPFPVIDPSTGRMDKALQDQLMTAFIEVMMGMNDNPFLEEPAERAAFEDGARKGVQFLKDAIAANPEATTALKDELATALQDGVLTDEERTSLADKLNEAGMEDAAAIVEDESATDEEIATIQEKVDGAASAKLEKDITAAMEDGKLTAEERATIEGRLGKEGLDALEKGVEDGTVTKEELDAIAKGTEADETAKAEAKAGTEGATDAKTGAETAAEGETPDGKPAAGSEDAKAAAGEVQGDGEKPAGEGETKPAGEGDSKPAGEGDSKPAGEGESKPAGEGESKPAGEGESKPAGEGESKPAEEPAAA